MAIDLTGIINENEFYTHHYLSAILETDLKDVFAKWEAQKKDEDIRPPYEALRPLARDYFRVKDQAARTRSEADKHQAEIEFMARLLAALGYDVRTTVRRLDDGDDFPIAGEIARGNGAPELWMVHGFNPNGDDVDPLEIEISDCSFEEAISRRVFGLAEPPRWVILFNLDQMLLLDRSKWNQKRFLRFDLNEIFGRREVSTFKAMSALLHRESVCPEDGLCLLDNLDENSHKHAFAVSEDLKYALRESIELLGNEAVLYMQDKHRGVYDRNLADQLTIECLRYMYRLLFLFYIEARPELGYAPMNADPYRMGYSLESLRDLESAPLTTEESRNGFFIHESIQLLFDMVYNGYPPQGRHMEMSWEGRSDINTFRILPLDAHLFDPERTPLLNGVRFRNVVLQEVVKRMSLTRPGSRRMRRGRISYAQLGINQLGSVYEALLSYRGFFAETDLYEVKKAGEKFDPLNIGYFVKAGDLEKYTDEEKFDENGRLVAHPRGEFIYRLAGRDREKSASYYTPESLTRCLVKYALKELLKDKSADEILGLTVCEPAMGSAAFLNEAVNQLAEAYLQKKQKELGRDIPHDEYLTEKQRVKMFLADNNVFGVDLNPVAVELAEVSLWLNTIYEGGFVPWFGLQLVCGNSLIGSRRQVFDSSLLKRDKRDDPLWLDEAPVRVPLGEKRPAKSVYHFLLPDKGMANYTDKVIKSLAGDEIKAINEWRKGFAKPFGKSDIQQLEKLSKKVDELWDSHVKELQHIRRRTSDPLMVFGQPAPKKGAGQTLTRNKDRVMNQELFSLNVRSSSAYRRLKLVMDYWCALWFWPIEKAEWLPTREEFLFEVSLLLEGDVYASEPSVGEQLALFPDTRPKQMSLEMLEKQGTVCVDELCEKFERFRIVGELVERYRFLHWELEFADLFAERGGFDLVLGNPPWIRAKFEMQKTVTEYYPLFGIRKYTASDFNRFVSKVINEDQKLIRELFYEANRVIPERNFLNSNLYALAKNTKTNLYKCFLEKSYYLLSNESILSMLHDTSIFDETGSQRYRNWLIKNMVYLFRFINELNHFPEEALDHRGNFAISILSNKYNRTNFDSISSLFHPVTIDQSYELTDTNKKFPEIRDENGWILEGHPDRIITFNQSTVEKINDIFRRPEKDLDAPLLTIYAKPLYDILLKRCDTLSIRQKVNSGKGKAIFDENAGLRNSLIIKEDSIPDNIEHLILSSPHFYVGTPIFKQPNEGCNDKSDYAHIDLSLINDNFIPRARFKLFSKDAIHKALSTKEYNNIKCYRLAWRTWVSPTNERTLITAIIPPNVMHVYPVHSMKILKNRDLLLVAGLTFSIIYDYFIRVMGIDHIWDEDILNLPYPEDLNTKMFEAIIERVLRLTCVTKYYSQLWEQENIDGLQWQRENMFLSHKSRRDALLELDVLSAMALNISIKDLLLLYKTQFPTLRNYDSETFYDKNGRIIFTTNRNYIGVGFSRSEWNDIKDMASGTVERTITDDTLPGGPRERTIVYHAPFDRCDREVDYDIAWREFESRL